MTNFKSRAAGFLLWVCAAALLPAQNHGYDQFAPKPVPPAVAVESAAPSTNVMAGQLEEVLLPSLRGLTFVARPEDVDAQTAKPVEGIVVGKNLPVPEPNSFNALVSPYLGHQLTRGKLDELITAIIVYYRSHDHPIVDVIVPQQDITSGVVQILVLESRVGVVKVTGNRWFSSNEIRRDFRLQPGDPIIATRMRQDLEWANQNPFHTSDVVYQPGATSGTTDVVLQTQDRLPVRLYVGYENSGNAQTGFDRYIAGVNWGDAWHAGLGHQFNYQYTTSADWQALRAHSGSYVIPLPWRHTLTFFGNYVQTKGEIPPVVSLEGKSYQISGRYTIPLPTIGEYKHTFGFGFDYKYNLNSLQFGNIPLTSSPLVVKQFVVTYDGSLRDRWGATSLDLQGYSSPGNWGRDNHDEAFDASHSLAKSSYEYATATLSRVTRLPAEWSLFLKGTFQVSTENLVPSEQLGLGGYDTVRGYAQREANTDEGAVFNVELRTPVMNLGKKFVPHRFDDQLQFLAFYDYGQGRNHTPLVNEPIDRTLSSVGIGLRYTVTPMLSVRADWGFPVHTGGVGAHDNERGDIGVVLSY